MSTKHTEMGMEMLQSGYNKAKPYLLMVVVQSGAAGMYLISSVVLKQGMSRYVLVVYRNAVGALVLAPFAIFLERSLSIHMFLNFATLCYKCVQTSIGKRRIKYADH